MPHQMILNSTSEQIAIAEEAADWLVDAVATTTQDRRFLRGDDDCNTSLVEALEANGVIACLRAMHNEA